MVFALVVNWLLAFTKTKKFDKKVIKPIITTTINMIFAKYCKVPVSYTMRSVVMAIGYAIVIPQTTVIAMNDCLVRIMSSNKNGHFTAIKRSTVIKVKLSIDETTIT